jgi:hypothetical protein
VIDQLNLHYTVNMLFTWNSAQRILRDFGGVGVRMGKALGAYVGPNLRNT